MAELETCPAPDELTSLLLGQVADTRGVQLERHLDACAHCLGVVENLQIESQIMDVLRAHGPGGPAALAVEPDLEKLMTSLASLDSQAGEQADHRHGDAFPRLAPPEQPGELGRLAHFRMLELLGAGGMGVVYVAEDTRLQRPVALKLLRPRLASDPQARARFVREARALASLKHQCVVVVHEVGEVVLGSDQESVAYMAMELLEGETLLAWMQRNRRPPLLDVVRLGRQIAEALAALHARGLIHRDVKPSNLWLEGKDGSTAEEPGSSSAAPRAPTFPQVKLLDFGLVLTAADTHDEARAQGTPAYMAPEQLRGEHVDERCDLFALGCILYELCTGEHPFPPKRRAGDSGPPLPVSDFSRGVPAELSHLVSRLLQENPGQRPESARAVARELAAMEKLLDVSAADTRDSSDTGAPGKSADQPRRRSLMKAAGFLGLVAMAGLAVWQLSADREIEPATAPVNSATPAPPVPSAHDAWCAKVHALPTTEQWAAVVNKLEELNPGYKKDNVAGWIEPEAVLRFSEKTDFLVDIRPLSCLADVKNLSLTGTKPGLGKLTNLNPLKGLRLHWLRVSNNPGLVDLAVLRNMPLQHLDISDTGVTGLEEIADCPIRQLNIARTPIRDLGPLKTLTELRILDCTGCPFSSLEPLLTTKVESIRLTFDANRDTPVLTRMKSVHTINGVPAKRFWDTRKAKS